MAASIEAGSTSQLPLDLSNIAESRRKLIQHQLLLLLHAKKCADRPNNDTCQLPHCCTMKQVLSHISGCREEKNCNYQQCTSWRRIIQHWVSCKNEQCPVCKDLKKTRQNDSSLLSSSIPPPSSSTSSSTSCVTVDPSSPSWRDNCSQHVRNYIVSKIENDMKSFLSMEDNLSYLHTVAARIERESFGSAASREDYFLTIAQKVFAITRLKGQKGLVSKRKIREQLRAKGGVSRQLVKNTTTAECVICLDDFRNSRRRKRALNCKHVFHSTCIKKWLSKSPACPLCRAGT